MRPIINRVKKDYSGSRIIFVADRGLNTSDNIYYHISIFKQRIDDTFEGVFSSYILFIMQRIHFFVVYIGEASKI